MELSEIEEILSKTDSNLYYFYVSKNMLMYSRRNLVDNYNRHFKLNSSSKKYNLVEKVHFENKYSRSDIGQRALAVLEEK